MNGIYGRGDEKHSEMDCSLDQMQGSSNTGCQTKDPSKGQGLFNASISRVYTRASLALPCLSHCQQHFPFCLLSLHLAGDKAIKVIDITGTMPNFGIAFTIWRTPLCPHLYYIHTNINTLLGCTKLSGWESTP